MQNSCLILTLILLHQFIFWSVLFVPVVHADSLHQNELSSPVHTCSMHVLSGDRTGRIPELHDGLHGIRRGVGHNGSHVPVTNTTKKKKKHVLRQI